MCFVFVYPPEKARLGGEASGRERGALRDRLLRGEGPSRLEHAGGDALGRAARSRLRRCKTFAPYIGNLVYFLIFRLTYLCLHVIFLLH